MKLAIASPLASTYSETFIRMQMERLPCTLRIHGRPVASETIPGGAITLMRSLRGILDTVIECGIRHKRREGPQAKELGRRMQRAGIDTVLANFGDASVALLPVCRAMNIKLVAHFHGYDAHMATVISSHQIGYCELGRKAAAVIAVSQYMADALANLGIPRAKIHVIRCGADSAIFTKKTIFPEAPLFFGVGRFVDKKAPYLTLLAFKTVHNQHPNARLVLGGDGPLLETTRNLCFTLGLESAVDFPGILSPSDVANWMQRATAYVQHSITPRYGPNKGDSEGTPVAILESMLTGLPTISTRHAGIGEVVTDGETGLLVEERDVDGMAQAMIALSQDTAKARRLGEAARKNALIHHTADVYIRSLQQILTCV